MTTTYAPIRRFILYRTSYGYGTWDLDDATLVGREYRAKSRAKEQTELLNNKND
jgi:hypothetical protein